MPVGMHRPKPSTWKNVWPFLAILVIVPAPSAPSSAAPSAPQSGTTPSPSPSSSAVSSQPDHGAVIQVLNGTETQGYAAAQASILNQAGYAGTSAANADGWATQTSAVFYEDPSMEATARDIASKLGISAVRQQSGLGDPDVVVVLR